MMSFRSVFLKLAIFPTMNKLLEKRSFTCRKKILPCVKN